MKMNVSYFVALAETFEQRFGVAFEGIRDGAVSDETERLRQFKTNIDIVMSVLDQNDLGEWLADRLVEIGDQVTDNAKLRLDHTRDPFQDDRLRVDALPVEPQTVTTTLNGETSRRSASNCSRGRAKSPEPGGRSPKSSSGSNHVTDNRFITVSADLSNSINVEKGSLTGHYDPRDEPGGNPLQGGDPGGRQRVHRRRSRRPERVPRPRRAQRRLGDVRQLRRVHARSCTCPARVWSQQNQDSPFRVGVLNILAGHSGPETAADARTHFGIFAPQVWKLFPRGQVIVLELLGLQRRRARLLRRGGNRRARPAGGRHRHRGRAAGLPGGRPLDVRRHRPQGRRQGLSTSFATSNPTEPRHGYMSSTQGSSSTSTSCGRCPDLEAAGHQRQGGRRHQRGTVRPYNRRPIATAVLPPEAKHDMMIVTTGTQRMWPVRDVGSADRRVLDGLRLARPLADRRSWSRT